jgi:hypothetical protein
MSVIDILLTFKKNYITFIEELVDQFPQEQELVMLRVLFVDQLQTDDIAQQFGEKVLPYEKLIKERNEQYFLQEDSIYKEVKTQSVIRFKKLWQSGTLDDEDKDVIWAWLDQFVLLINKYIKTLAKENPPAFRIWMNKITDPKVKEFLFQKTSQT